VTWRSSGLEPRLSSFLPVTAERRDTALRDRGYRTPEAAASNGGMK
jgi:hypothetical protein